MLNLIKKDLRKLGDPAKAETLSRFFKTGKGQYGEGDMFLGITVPRQREIAQKYSNLPLEELQKLLAGDFHEYRLTALFILIAKYGMADRADKKEIVNFYLDNSTNMTSYTKRWVGC
jgi:hypothetical protein